MKVLVTAASRHGATLEIADRVAEVLRRHGHETERLLPEDVRRLDGFGAVVLGSALYTGGWLKPARTFAARFAGELTDLPLWLFSSGPVGDPPFPQHQDIARVDEIARHSGARDHRIFPGRLDLQVLNLRERIAARAASVAPGDYRDWAAVEDWAEGVATTLGAFATPRRSP